MRRKRLISLTLAAMLMLSFTGCEKKANTVVGLGGNTSDGSTANAESDGTGETEGEDSASGSEDSLRWVETYQSTAEMGIENVSVNVHLKDYTQAEYKAVTVEVPSFTKLYIQKMCETVFDSTDDLEVYDYDKKTKRVYDEQIEALEDTLELYKAYTSSESASATYLDYMPDEYLPNSGNWAMSEIYGDFDESVIEKDIDKLKEKREEAPDSLENDFSYRGYIGQVNGEEFYMYFGNRNYDEYMNSPETTQFNGRVITIMKKDITGDYHGFDYNNISFEGGGLEDFDSDSIVFKKNSICLGYEAYSEGTVSNVSQNYLDEAEEFLGKLGYGDYTYCENESRNMYWGNELSMGYIYKTGYYMTSSYILDTDGYILRYRLDFENADMLRYSDVCLPAYSISSDAMDINSYVEIMINDAGVLGCQIFNPMEVKTVDTVNKIIDNETLKDVLADSVDDMTVWNFPIGSVTVSGNIVNVSLQDVKLISFPIKSDTDATEFTYIPCYMVYKKLWDEATTGNVSPFGYSSSVETPFLLVNAIDGSLVTVNEEISLYPYGWKNDNMGYYAYIYGDWDRFYR